MGETTAFDNAGTQAVKPEKQASKACQGIPMRAFRAMCLLACAHLGSVGFDEADRILSERVHSEAIATARAEISQARADGRLPEKGSSSVRGGSGPFLSNNGPAHALTVDETPVGSSGLLSAGLAMTGFSTGKRCDVFVADEAKEAGPFDDGPENLRFVSRHEESHCVFKHDDPSFHAPRMPNDAVFAMFAKAYESGHHMAKRFSMVRSESAADVMAVLSAKKGESAETALTAWAWRRFSSGGSLWMAGGGHSTDEALRITSVLLANPEFLGAVESATARERSRLALSIADAGAALWLAKNAMATGADRDFELHRALSPENPDLAAKGLAAIATLAKKPPSMEFSVGSVKASFKWKGPLAPDGAGNGFVIMSDGSERVSDELAAIMTRKARGESPDLSDAPSLRGATRQAAREAGALARASGLSSETSLPIVTKRLSNSSAIIAMAAFEGVGVPAEREKEKNKPRASKPRR